MNGTETIDSISTADMTEDSIQPAMPGWTGVDWRIDLKCQILLTGDDPPP